MDWCCSDGEGLMNEGMLMKSERLGGDLVPTVCAVTEDVERLQASGTSGDVP